MQPRQTVERGVLAGPVPDVRDGVAEGERELEQDRPRELLAEGYRRVAQDLRRLLDLGICLRESSTLKNIITKPSQYLD